MRLFSGALRSAGVGAVLVTAALLGSCTEECTLLGCESRLEVEVVHALELEDGPYRLEVTTPLQSLRCSFGPALSGDETCFGYRFSDLHWDEDRVTLSLIDPFFDAASSPDGEPFERVDVSVFRGSELLSEQTVDIAAGEPELPNGEGCPPACWTARGSITLP